MRPSLTSELPDIPLPLDAVAFTASFLLILFILLQPWLPF
jgi:hypothetical protein